MLKGMSGRRYHIYLEWPAHTIRAVRLDQMGRDRAAMTETICQVMAQNKDDALRVAVAQGHVTKLIDGAEKNIAASIVAIAQDPTARQADLLRHGIAQTAAWLERYRAVQAAYELK